VRAPRSLRGRVALFASFAIVVGVLLVDLLLVLSVRAEFDREVQRAMDARVGLVEELDDGRSAEAVSEALTARGVPAIAVGPDGERYPTGGAAGLPPGPHARRVVELADGTTVEVLVSRARTEAAQRRMLLTAVAGTTLALLALAVALWVVADRLLRPLDEVVATARSIARGRTGARLARGEDGRPRGPWHADPQLDQLAAAFDEMLDAQEAAIEEARAAEVRSRRFLADAAHQLRTPVAGLRAASEALLRAPDTADRDRLLEHLAREAARAGRRLDALLRVAELDRGDSPHLEAADLVAVVEDELDRQRPLAPSLTFALHGPPSLPVQVDVEGLREAIANLLDNARRHARDRVEVTVTGDRTIATVRVADDGPGLPAGEEEAVFGRFVSLDDRGGSGLGLPIARSIARVHGGDVRWAGGAFELAVARRP
jgi:two-component system, OmpR family, sensor kinase